MIEQPLVSICIPTYNAALTVRETLLSILAQTYSNIVVHVSDNASTDETLDIVESLNDPRIRIHRQQMNLGGEGNFNKCIQLAEGKYTAIFHADDLYEPQMVEQQVAFLESHTQAGAVFTEAALIDESGKNIGAIRFPDNLGSYEQVYDFEKIFKAVLEHSNFLVCPSVMARTKVYQEDIKQWRGEQFKSSADLDVWLRIASKHPVGLLPKALMKYRISDHQFSARVRLQTDRPDFFLVIEHYLTQAPVSAMLDKADFEHFNRLDRRDRVMRAVNLFLDFRSDEARSLVDDIFSWDAIKAGLQTKRGLGVLIAGVYIRSLLLLRLESVGRITLGYLKRVMRK